VATRRTQLQSQTTGADGQAALSSISKDDMDNFIRQDEAVRDLIRQAEEFLYPRDDPKRSAAVDEPDEDDLDALMAEAEETRPSTTRMRQRQEREEPIQSRCETSPVCLPQFQLFTLSVTLSANFPFSKIIKDCIHGICSLSMWISLMMIIHESGVYGVC
jgi:hypothetical protein